MDKRLEEIRARVDSASPGPWKDDVTGQGDLIVYIDGDGHDLVLGDMEVTCKWCHTNAAFIAHARSDVPYLLDQLTHSQGRIAELEGAIRRDWRRQINEYSSYDYCAFCEADVEKEPHLDGCIVRTLPEQQPTTLTKEGGGGE